MADPILNLFDNPDKPEWGNSVTQNKFIAWAKHTGQDTKVHEKNLKEIYDMIAEALGTSKPRGAGKVDGEFARVAAVKRINKAVDRLKDLEDTHPGTVDLMQTYWRAHARDDDAVNEAKVELNDVLGGGLDFAADSSLRDALRAPARYAEKLREEGEAGFDVKRTDNKLNYQVIRGGLVVPSFTHKLNKGGFAEGEAALYEDLTRETHPDRSRNILSGKGDDELSGAIEDAKKSADARIAINKQRQEAELDRIRESDMERTQQEGITEEEKMRRAARNQMRVDFQEQQREQVKKDRRQEVADKHYGGSLEEMEKAQAAYVKEQEDARQGRLDKAQAEKQEAAGVMSELTGDKDLIEKIQINREADAVAGAGGEGNNFDEAMTAARQAQTTALLAGDQAAAAEADALIARLDDAEVNEKHRLFPAKPTIRDDLADRIQMEGMTRDTARLTLDEPLEELKEDRGEAEYRADLELQAMQEEAERRFPVERFGDKAYDLRRKYVEEESRREADRIYGVAAEGSLPKIGREDVTAEGEILDKGGVINPYAISYADAKGRIGPNERAAMRERYGDDIYQKWMDGSLQKAVDVIAEKQRMHEEKKEAELAPDLEKAAELKKAMGRLDDYGRGHPADMDGDGEASLDEIEAWEAAGGRDDYFPYGETDRTVDPSHHRPELPETRSLDQIEADDQFLSIRDADALDAKIANEAGGLDITVGQGGPRTPGGAIPGTQEESLLPRISDPDAKYPPLHPRGYEGLKPQLEPPVGDVQTDVNQFLDALYADERPPPSPEDIESYVNNFIEEAKGELSEREKKELADNFGGDWMRKAGVSPDDTYAPPASPAPSIKPAYPTTAEHELPPGIEFSNDPKLRKEVNDFLNQVYAPEQGMPPDQTLSDIERTDPRRNNPNWDPNRAAWVDTPDMTTTEAWLRSQGKWDSPYGRNLQGMQKEVGGFLDDVYAPQTLDEEVGGFLDDVYAPPASRREPAYPTTAEHTPPPGIKFYNPKDRLAGLPPTDAYTPPISGEQPSMTQPAPDVVPTPEGVRINRQGRRVPPVPESGEYQWNSPPLRDPRNQIPYPYIPEPQASSPPNNYMGNEPDMWRSPLQSPASPPSPVGPANRGELLQGLENLSGVNEIPGMPERTPRPSPTVAGTVGGGMESLPPPREEYFIPGGPGLDNPSGSRSAYDLNERADNWLGKADYLAGGALGDPSYPAWEDAGGHPVDEEDRKRWRRQKIQSLSYPLGTATVASNY